MNSALFLQIATVVSDLIIFIFVGYYFFLMQKDKRFLAEKEMLLEKKTQEIEAKYDQLIDEAHNEKKKILQETSQKANSIISDTQFVTDSSRKFIEEALQKLSIELQKKAESTSNEQVETYENYLNQVSQKSIENFNAVTQRFASELDKQAQNFRQEILTNMQKEIEQYKTQRIQKAEQQVDQVVQKIAQKVVNRSLSTEDHKKLILESLEKSQKEGVFD